MSKLLATIFASMLVLASVSGFAAELEKKGDGGAAACKDKKVGDEVTVNGNKVKCPEPKKAK